MSPAGFSFRIGVRQRSSARAAPASIAVVSMPATAAGRRPTGESTEKRPPTLRGIGRLGIPSLSAIARSGPSLGSVVKRKWPLAFFGSYLLKQEALQQQVQRHRLCRRARLTDDVEESAANVEALQQVTHQMGIDIVEHVEAGEVVPHLSISLVPQRPQQGVAQRAGAECRSADPEDHHVLEPLPVAVGQLLGASQSLRGIRKIEEPRSLPCIDRSLQPREPSGIVPPSRSLVAWARSLHR